MRIHCRYDRTTPTKTPHGIYWMFYLKCEQCEQHGTNMYFELLDQMLWYYTAFTVDPVVQF